MRGGFDCPSGVRTLGMEYGDASMLALRKEAKVEWVGIRLSTESAGEKKEGNIEISKEARGDSA